MNSLVHCTVTEGFQDVIQMKLRFRMADYQNRTLMKMRFRMTALQLGLVRI